MNVNSLSRYQHECTRYTLASHEGEVDEASKNRKDLFWGLKWHEYTNRQKQHVVQQHWDADWRSGIKCSTKTNSCWRGFWRGKKKKKNSVNVRKAKRHLLSLEISTKVWICSQIIYFGFKATCRGNPCVWKNGNNPSHAYRHWRLKTHTHTHTNHWERNGWDEGGMLLLIISNINISSWVINLIGSSTINEQTQAFMWRAAQHRLLRGLCVSFPFYSPSKTDLRALRILHVLTSSSSSSSWTRLFFQFYLNPHNQSRVRAVWIKTSSAPWSLIGILSGGHIIYKDQHFQ